MSAARASSVIVIASSSVLEPTCADEAARETSPWVSSSPAVRRGSSSSLAISSCESPRALGRDVNATCGSPVGHRERNRVRGASRGQRTFERRRLPDYSRHEVVRSSFRRSFRMIEVAGRPVVICASPRCVVLVLGADSKQLLDLVHSDSLLRKRWRCGTRATTGSPTLTWRHRSRGLVAGAVASNR